MNIILNNKKINIFTILAVSFFFFMPNFSNASIVTLLKPLGFIASAIADGVTSVEVIIPNGATIHNYSLRPSDIMRIKNADFIILLGNDTEPFFLKKIIYNLKKKNIQLSKIKKIKLYLIHNSPPVIHKKKQKNTLQNKKEINILYDMHIWLSPKIALESAIAIHNMLIKIIPEKKIIIDRNLKNFKLNLFQLDQDIKEKLLSIKEKKYFIFHDAYKYFEKYYGLNPIKYFGKYPGIQPGAKSLYEIKNQLLQKKVSCVFTEPQFNENIIDVIIRKTNIQKGFLDPLGTTIPLSKDSYLKFLLKLSDQYIRCLEKPEGIK